MSFTPLAGTCVSQEFLDKTDVPFSASVFCHLPLDTEIRPKPMDFDPGDPLIRSVREILGGQLVTSPNDLVVYFPVDEPE